ncbi:MAG: DMT family transporter [Firmicutes bacterium]|nr:DMT family transporter [Bacillota bacterium]
MAVLVAVTLAAWAVWGVILKLALRHGDAYALILWSSFFSLFMLPANWLVLRHLRVTPRAEPGLLLWAALGVAVSGVAVWTYPLALARGSAGLVTALTAGYPAGTLLLAAVFLGERPTLPQVGGVLLTAAGLLLLGR